MKIKNNVANCETMTWVMLKTYETNKLKKEKDRDVDKLKAAIVNRGFNFPFYVWAGHKYILDGAGRIMALDSLEKEGYVIDDLPIVEIHAESFEQAKALVLQASSEHGKITQKSFDEFTADINLKEFIDEINLPDIDINFDMVTELEPESDPDAGSGYDGDGQPFTQTGDLYEIGPHRLLCGDSTNPLDLDRLVQISAIHAVLTDVPYGISRESNGLRELDYGSWDHGDCLQVTMDALNLVEPVPTITAFCAAEQMSHLLSNFVDRSVRGFAWTKTNPNPMNGEHIFLSAVEFGVYGKKQGAYFGGHCEKNWWSGPFPSGHRDHPCQKPVDLFKWLIEMTCPEGGIVYDCFGGSGTTMAAAQMVGRRAMIMEQDPKYCDAIVSRMKKLFPTLHILHNGQPI